MYKKTFIAISLLVIHNLETTGVFQHHGQTGSSSSTHVATTTQGVSGSSELIMILQDIASSLSSSVNATALSAILQQLHAGVNFFDIQIFEQALQEALQIIASSGGVLNAFTIIEYTGILVESIGQLEAARLQSTAATSTTVTSTVTK